jgi:hypothetical protein
VTVLEHHRAEVGRRPVNESLLSSHIDYRNKLMVIFPNSGEQRHLLPRRELLTAFAGFIEIL